MGYGVCLCLFLSLSYLAMNSRNKGKRGELELAAFLRSRGIEARRGQQFSGGTDSPDVVTALGDIHFECKRVEAGSLYDWLGQAQRDAGKKLPVVAHRKNGRGWVAILTLDDLLSLIAMREDKPNGTASSDHS